MKKRFVHAAFAACLLGATALTAVAVSTPAVAASQSVSSDVARPLSEAQKLANNKDFKGALAKVKEAAAVSNRTPFDDYTIAQFTAFIDVNLQDYAGATAAYEQMAASPAEPASNKVGTLHNLVLLTYQEKQYDKTVKYGEQLEALNSLDSKLEAPLSQAYYFTNDFAKAEALSKKIVDADTAAGRKPDQGVLSVLLSSQVKQNDQAGAEQTLELLAANYGNPDDWGQLIDIALGTAGIQNTDAMDLLRLRDTVGAMKTADDYSMMANIALLTGYPGEADRILEEGISAGKISSSGKTAGLLSKARSGVAQDKKTLAAFAKDAAKRSGGEYSAKLAETYYGYQRYADAEAAARQAISKGGLKDPAQAQMVLGMALAGEGKYAQAEQTFKQINAASPVRAKAAHLWALYAEMKAGQTASAAPAAPAQAAPAQGTPQQ